jgi:transcriptional regulator with XRE-family HTH domain
MAYHDMTNESLAKEIGTSHVMISNWRNGKAEPSLDYLNKLIAFFKLEDTSKLLETDNV